MVSARQTGWLEATRLMPSEFDYVETPTEGEVDRWGFTIKPSISDNELIIICLKNAPCGSDKKQVERLIKNYEK